MADGRGSRGADGRRQRRREDETRSIGTDRIDQRDSPRDIAAEATEGLGQRSFDYVDPVHGTVARGDAGATRAIHAHRMDLVEVRHRAITIGNVTDATDR